MFDISSKGVSQEDFYRSLIGFSFDEADKLWDKFFSACFAGDSDGDKSDFLTVTEFYSLFMIIVVIIDWCHRFHDDPVKNAPRLEVIRKFMKEMRTFETSNFPQIFAKWTKGEQTGDGTN